MAARTVTHRLGASSHADTIAVMYEGRIVATLDAATATREQVGLLMAGAAPEQERERSGQDGARPAQAPTA